MRLKNKIAVITGAGAGIGAATAKLFAQEGAKVLVADFDFGNASKVADDIGASAIASQVDVRNEADTKRMIDEATGTFGALDILVNNAGRGLIGTVETTAEKDWDDIVSVNLKSIYLCSKHAIPHIRKRGGGAIVNTASNVATVGIKDRAAYVAAKGGAAALTRAMALDFAGDNIRVNSVAPGVIWSSYYEKIITQVPDPVAFKAALAARAPTNQMGTPEDIANMILFLASDESKFATGAMFTVDGGMTAW
jgi:NAD(P)-dependent dehydrogenase (short-subunit alcohol dehydrogenase family)